VSAVAGTLTITDARVRCAAALAPQSSTDPDVQVSLVDALSPPTLMVGWTDPWLEPSGQCRFVGRLTIWCIAGRYEPGAVVELLEGMVSQVVARMHADGYGWGLPNVSAPRVYPFANIDYLGAQVVYLVHVTTDEGS
jgi:hypothetical protein